MLSADFQKFEASTIVDGGDGRPGRVRCYHHETSENMEDPMADRQLRPVERTVRRLKADGLSTSEVAWRLRRSPGYVRQVETLSRIERPSQAVAADDQAQGRLRPIERCVLNSLKAGAGYAEIAARLRRSPTYVSRVEKFANLRVDMGL